MKLTDSEWTVMNALWRHSPASTRDVLDTLGHETDWAYTTVKTMLERLVEKGALSSRRRANKNLYEPRITREEARRTAVRSLLDKAFDGAFGPLLQHIVADEKLSGRDRRELERMLADLDREPGSEPGGAGRGHGERTP